MPELRSLYLVGFMGSGKSTVGRLLAHRLNCPFFDLDEEVARHSGKTIPAIFAESGEAVFRQMEVSCLQTLLEKQNSKPCVISLGGGAFITPAIRELAAQTGISVWLNLSFEECLNRIAGDGNRPLLQNLERARELFGQRQPVYAQANIQLDAQSASPSELAQRILARIEN
ncbi:MAG: shikimate kinase [Blastocatellia bacterium]|nr:shikimate kinase [Blastocatellia bacterium]